MRAALAIYLGTAALLYLGAWAASCIPVGPM